MCLSRGFCIGISSIVKRYTILCTGRNNLREAEPELVIPSVGLFLCCFNLNTTASINSFTIYDDRRLRIALIHFSEEATNIITFHITVDDKVSPTYSRRIFSLFHFHACHCHICPVGTLDTMQVTEALILDDCFNVNNISSVLVVAFLSKILL